MAVAAQIRPNRLDVTDRFPMLGFTIRTDGAPRKAEVALATDPTLFRADRKDARTPSTFYSSRAAGPLSIPRGEAVFVVPPEVLARFIGQPQLYVALATAPERNGAMRVDVVPTEGSPYISLSGLTGRSLRRVRLLPTRQQRQAGYGVNGGSDLAWAGDAASPGAVPVNGGHGNGVSAAPAAPAPVEYDDGFGPLPRTATPAAPDGNGSIGSAPHAGAGGASSQPVAQAFDLSRLSLSGATVPVTPPPVTVLSGWQATAAQAALTAFGGPVAPLLTALPLAARAGNVSIGLGPAVSGGLGAGAGLGTGIIFGNDGRLGVYGAAEFQNGFISSISATVQLTVVGGPIENFNGWSTALAVSGGEGVVGGAAALFDMNANFQGVTLQAGVGAGLSPVDFYVAVQRQIATALALSGGHQAYAQGGTGLVLRSGQPAAAGMTTAIAGAPPSRAMNVTAATVDLKFRMFIPAPLIAGPIGVYGGDGRGFSLDQGTSRGELNARVNLTPGGGINSISVIGRHWGESTEYAESDAIVVAGKPAWWRDKRPGATPINRGTLAVTDENLKVYAGAPGTTRNVEAMVDNASIITIEAIGAMPLSPVAPEIDADLSVMLRYSGGNIEAKVVGAHDGFPAYELYANGQRIYSYDPVAAGNDPSALFPTMDVTARTNWRTVGVLSQAAAFETHPDAGAEIDAAHGIDGPIPDEPPAAAAAAFARAGAFQQQPEYPQASRFVAAASTNYRATTSPRTIDKIVIHITDGGPNIAGTISWFQNPAAQVSAHYVIGRDGEVVQMVRHNDVAWHARSANTTSIGIEHCANTRGLDPTEAQYCASSALVSWLCGTYGIPVDRTHILGHREAVETTKTCPGPAWNWDHFMDLTTNQYCAPLAQGASAQAFNQSFTINWDDVQQVAQPTGRSCWAAAAAMVVGWKDQMSLNAESISAICNRTTGGLHPSDVGTFAREIGLVPENPQCYTVEGFRHLLETKGPLWVGAAIPSLHVVVVTGMYADGDDVFVRITDPLDRVVGTPGAPGPRPGTHTTGSRYIMRWEDFVREYESAPMDHASVNLQILHSGSTFGRQANRGPATPAGYAQALRAARGQAVRRYATAHDDASPAVEAIVPEPAPVSPVRRIDTGTSGAVRWSLEQYDGLRRPSTPGDGRIAQGAQRTVRLDDWPLLQLPAGSVQLPLTVTWRHDAGAVGDIAVQAGPPQSVDGWSLSVTGDVVDGAETPGATSLAVSLRYVFSHAGQPDIAAATELTLFGDGTYQRQDRWEQAEAGAA